MKDVIFPEKESFAGEISTSSNDKFLRAALGETKNTQFLSRNSTAFAIPTTIEPDWLRMDKRLDLDKVNTDDLMKGLKTKELVDSSISRLFVATHNAFDMHVPLTLSPEVLWYAIVNQVAIYVKNNAADHKKYFSASTSDEKSLLEVRDDSLVYGQPSNWTSTIALFRDQLAENMSTETLGIFLPKFSTTNAETEAATLVNFMDLVSEYYEFSVMTLCGIPKFRFEGTVEDWRLLARKTQELSELIPIPGYFADLVPVLVQLALGMTQGFSRESLDSAYKVKEQSGGPYASGWLTALNAYVVMDDGSLKMKEVFDWQAVHESGGGYTTNQFPSHVSRVNFTWKYLGTELPMIFAGGILGIDSVDGYLIPKLGVGVFEV